MTLSQLRTFAAVADAGSVRGAAQRLHVTQPAVSAAVRALERSLGLALVEPDGRGVRLTEAGETFAGYLRRVLGLLDEASLAARGGADPARGTVRIGAVPTASEHVLPRFLAAFRRTYPDLTVVLEVGTKEQVWGWIADHAVDVVVAGRPPTDGTGLAVRARRHNELLVVAAPGVVDDAGAAPGVVGDVGAAPGVAGDAGAAPGLADDAGAARPLVALEGHTWLLREEGSGIRATLEAMLAADEMAPETLTLGSNGAVVAGAVAGLGVTLISRDAVDDELAAGALEVVTTDVTPLIRPWHLVSQPHPPPTAELFVRHLLDVASRRPAPRFEPEPLPTSSPGVAGE